MCISPGAFCFWSYCSVARLLCDDKYARDDFSNEHKHTHTHTHKHSIPMDRQQRDCTPIRGTFELMSEWRGYWRYTATAAARCKLFWTKERLESFVFCLYERVGARGLHWRTNVKWRECRSMDIDTGARTHTFSEVRLREMTRHSEEKIYSSHENAKWSAMTRRNLHLFRWRTELYKW